MKEKPGTVTVATAGVNSSGYFGIEALAKAAGVTYKHVSYDGGNPAVIATVSGETQVTTQLGVEQADMLRGSRLRALAVISDSPLELEGVGSIPPITQWFKDYKPDANYFGVFVPADAPAEVTATLDQVWADTIANSAALKKYAAERGAIFRPSMGDEAREPWSCRQSAPRPGSSRTAARRKSRRRRSASPVPDPTLDGTRRSHRLGLLAGAGAADRPAVLGDGQARDPGGRPVVGPRSRARPDRRRADAARACC